MARLSVRERAGLPDRAFAYIDAAGQRRLPIHDAAHVRSALSRFDQVRFESDDRLEPALARTNRSGAAIFADVAFDDLLSGGLALLPPDPSL